MELEEAKKAPPGRNRAGISLEPTDEIDLACLAHRLKVRSGNRIEAHVDFEEETGTFTMWATDHTGETCLIINNLSDGTHHVYLGDEVEPSWTGTDLSQLLELMEA